MQSDDRPVRFRDEEGVLGGVVGQHVSVASASPRNYHEAITDPSAAEPVELDGKLFLPSDRSDHPAVIMVPGSLGVGPNHRAHSETLVQAGFAVLVLELLRGHPMIDVDRIHAQGHSRGGAAVLTAASRRFADPIVGTGVGLAAVYAAYPWGGHQFRDPDAGRTRVRAILAEADEWCSVQQAQAHVHAMRVAGADATARVVAGAAHSFDRVEPVHELADAVVAPQAPTVYLADDGAMIDPTTDRPDPELVDIDMFLAAATAGFARYGASIGGVGHQPDLFRDDMLAFHAAPTTSGPGV